MNLGTEFLLITACLQPESLKTSLFKTVGDTWFEDPDHRLIFQAAHIVVCSGGPFSLEAVASELVAKGRPDLSSTILTNPPSDLSADGIEDMVKALKAERDNEMARSVLSKAESMLRDGRTIDEVRLFTSTNLDLGVRDTITSAKSLARTPVEVSTGGGMLTGVVELDSVFGIKSGQMGILAARPGVGKTALALQIALKTAASGERVVFVSYEMTPNELIQRIGLRDSQKCASTVLDKLSGDIVFLDGQSTYIESLVSRVSALVRAGGCTALVVDYVQQMHTHARAESRQQEMASVSGALKALAMEAGIPVLVVSQLNRRASVDGADPELHDLRDSGALEQDADKVMFLSECGKSSSADDVRKLQATVSKNRQGHRGSVTLGYFPELQIFRAWR